MSEIPASWLECTLGDIVDYGATKKAEPSEIPPDAWVLELEDIEKDTSRILTRATFRERGSKSTKNEFKNGDVLYGKLRPYLNKVVRAKQDGFCTTEIVPLSPTELVAGDYLFHWLKHPRFLDYVGSVSHGLNMPRLGTEAGRKAPFVLAPLNEQKRIAEKLDSLLTRVDTCRERLDRIPNILKRFRQSILVAACSGELSKVWREKSGISKAEDWIAETRLSEICATISDGDHLAPPKESTGIPFLTIGNISSGRLDFTATRFVDESYFEKIKPERKPSRGSLLYTVVGASIGIPVLVDTDRPFCFQRHIAILKASEKVLPKFLWILMSSKLVYDQAWQGTTGTAQPTLPLGNLRGIVVSLPPVAEQAEIVRRVEKLMAFADQVESRLMMAQTRVNRLTSSSLSKAFRGELVPQDASDEPAGELLKRTQLAKKSNAENPKEKKSDKRVSKKKAATIMLNRSEIQLNHLTEILRSHGSLTAEALWAASQLAIDDFYDQLKAEEEKGLLKERRKRGDNEVRLLEVA